MEELRPKILRYNNTPGMYKISTDGENYKIHNEFDKHIRKNMKPSYWAMVRQQFERIILIHILDTYFDIDLGYDKTYEEVSEYMRRNRIDFTDINDR